MTEEWFEGHCRVQPGHHNKPNDSPCLHRQLFCLPEKGRNSLAPSRKMAGLFRCECCEKSLQVWYLKNQLMRDPGLVVLSVLLCLADHKKRDQ
jgi:hypothetical protein